MAKTTKQVKILDNSDNPDSITTNKAKKELKKIDKNLDISIISNPEDDLFMSGRQTPTHHLTFDLDLPTQTDSPFSPLDQQRWIIAIEKLLTKGCNSYQMISKVTGLSTYHAKNFVTEIKERWQKNMSSSEVNLRREHLYSEHDRIKRHCWNMIDLADVDENRNMLGYLKTIQTSLNSQAKLIGAEMVSVDITSNNIRAMTQDELQNSAAKMLDIDPANLKLLGDMLANSITDPLEEPEDNEDESEEE